jgi:RNA polymerase sigma-70 factor (ECF subfamily)
VVLTPRRQDDTRWSVVARAAAGDRDARAQFAHDYLPAVRSFLDARWQKSVLASSVDDAVQEVFLECVRDGGVLLRADPARGDFRGLLFGVACNVARRFEERAQKHRNRSLPTDSALADLPAREPSLSVLFDREWAMIMVRLARDLMGERAAKGSAAARARWELLRLRFAEGQPIRAIAAQWQVDPDALHQAYAKAREEFRSCLRAVVAAHAVRQEEDLEAEVARILALLD